MLDECDCKEVCGWTSPHNWIDYGDDGEVVCTICDTAMPSDSKDNEVLITFFCEQHGEQVWEKEVGENYWEKIV
jgi:hypothetical protein